MDPGNPFYKRSVQGGLTENRNLNLSIPSNIGEGKQWKQQREVGSWPFHMVGVVGGDPEAGL